MLVCRLGWKLASRQKAGTPNIETIERTFPYKIEAYKRANRDDLNDAICMLIGPVVVKLFSKVWVGGNVRFWWGSRTERISVA
jgi:hypothetical protein